MKSSYLIFSFVLITSISLSSAADFPSAPDWEQLSEIATYHPENLWEYINGAADQFIDYGFQSCSVGEFKSVNVSFSIDIYDMVEAINAYGVYMTESRGIETKLKIGSEAAITLPSQCLMFKNKYYIKVYAFEGQLTNKSAENILSVIADALPGETGLPAALASLPEKNRIPGSEGFTRIGYLGLSELRNCLYASYANAPGEDYQYFNILPLTGENALQIFETLAPSWIQQEWKGPPLKIRKIPYKGYTGIILYDTRLTGVSNAASPEIIRQRLRVLITD